MDQYNQFCFPIPRPTRQPEEMMVTDSQGHIMSVPITPQKLQRGLKVSDFYGPCASGSEITRKKTHTISNNGSKQEKSAPAQRTLKTLTSGAVSSSERVITNPGNETCPVLKEIEQNDIKLEELATFENLEGTAKPAEEYDESIFEGLDFSGI